MVDMQTLTGVGITASSTNTLTNKTYDTAGTGNLFSINGVAATANTGTGAVARAAAPTFTTPVLGVASATSLNLGGAAALTSYTRGTWTPVWTSLVVVGSPTYTGTYTKIGRMVFCTLDIASSTTTASTAGTTTFASSGLPFAVAIESTMSALNGGSLASIGVGYIGATNCFTPTWTATQTVVISFFYQATTD